MGSKDDKTQSESATVQTITANTDSQPTKRWCCDVCRNAWFDEYRDACAHEELCLKQQQKDDDEAQIRDGSSQEAPPPPAATVTTNQKAPVHPFFTANRASKQKSKNAFNKPKTRTNKRSKGKTSSITNKQSAQTKKPKRSSPSHEKAKEDETKLVDVTDPALLETQRQQWAFLSQRQSKAKRKTSKPAAAPSSSGTTRPTNTASASSITTTTKPVPKQTAKRRRGKLAPRFPVPSHVLPVPFSSAADTTTTTNNGDGPSSSCTLHLPNARTVNCLVDTTDCDVALLNGKDQSNLPWFSETREDPFVSLLVRTVSTAITNNKNTEESPLPRPSTSTEDLWNDAVVVGTAMQSVQEGLTEFIERFMVQRHRAEIRMETKQNKSNNNKRKRKKRKTVDEDLWLDSDDETEQSKSLCVLHGPVGCGKSQLVYRVAQEKDNSVLELHPGDLRTGIALRRKLEEATQSHSSLDMIQNKKQKLDEFFQIQTKREQLIDSEDEEDDSKEETTAKESKVKVILIDEVDILFEEDTAFWNALKDLTKKSKCPIILTCNVLPKQLASFRYTYLPAARPSPAECNAFLKKAFGQLYDFESLAVLGNCDLRFILKQMEAYRLAQMVLPTAAVVSQESEEASDDTSSDRAKSKTEEWTRPPAIESVQPKAVFSDRYTLLTIRGSNFLPLMDDSGSCRVMIGEQPCPETRVVDDATILVVCPPRRLVPGIDSTGNYEGTRKRSVAAAYLPVVVAGSASSGRLSTSAANIASMDLFDQTRVLISSAPILLEIHFPGHTSTLLVSNDKAVEALDDDGSASGAEFEFTDEELEQSSSTVCHHRYQIAPPPLVRDTDRTEATELLQNAVKEWCKKNGSLPKPVRPSKPVQSAREDMIALDDLALHCSYASDSVLLEEGLGGVPYLAGACRGFGFDLTDEFPKRTNDNSKPPSEEQLFHERWKDDCYFFGDGETHFTQPMGLESKLLCRKEATYRGQAPPLSLENDEKEQSEDDKHKKTATATTTVSDEDCLLPNVVGACLKELPGLLRSVHPCVIDEINRLSRGKKRDCLLAQFQYVLCEFVFLGAKREQQYFRSMNRVVSPLLDAESMLSIAPSISLDYLPALRSMTVYDEATEHAYKATGVTDSEQGKRSTRRSKRSRGFDSYLRRIIPDFVSHDYDETIHEFRSHLADAPLLICGSNDSATAR